MPGNTSLLPWSWNTASADLGIEIVAPFEVVLASGECIKVHLLVPHFGAAKGMLLLTDYSLIEDHTSEIIQAGYGFSVFSEPEASEEYDRDSYIEVLRDWGWSGPESEKPAWLQGEAPETA